ncbi:MAG: glycosyltransferase family 4 protein [Gelidibacter sp.]|nr:glycosyltransferase family 4 protein [Gelidibacter sp.]
MKILVVTQYFWPENFRINDLCLGLRERGHEVTVLTGKPNYPKGDFYHGYSMFNKSNENWKGINIIRTALIRRKKGGGLSLMINYLSFAFFASIKAIFIKGDFDKIFVYEPSPITVGFPAIIAKWKFKIPIYFWVQDLWPESIAAASGLKNKFVLQIMDGVTRFIYKKSSKILVQSQAFIPYILKQNVKIDKLVYYPNSTEAFYRKLEPQQKYKKMFPQNGGLNLLFAGNIGESQSFDTLIEAALLIKNKNTVVNWIILGDGRLKEYVRNRIEQLGLKDTFILMGSFPSSEMPSFFACADALIVSLKRNPIFSYTIPSKVQSYMACGKPIIASLDGEGAKVVTEAFAGFSSSAENAGALAENIIKFIALNENDRNKLGENAQKYFEREFEREFLLSKLEEIFKN